MKLLIFDYFVLINCAKTSTMDIIRCPYRCL